MMPAPWPTRSECGIAFGEGDGSGITVAVLDTGVDASHPCFADASFPEPMMGSIRAGQPHIGPCGEGDPVGHGTAIAARILHLAPRAGILSIRVLDSASRQKRHEIIRAGALAALERGVDVINCSFGVPATFFSLSPHLEWTDAAFRAGVPVIAAASNASPDHPEWPAHLTAVLAVRAGASEANRWTWSRGQPVPITAAGVDIEVPVPGGRFTSVTGSSFATAHISGLAARLLSRYPGTSPGLLREAFQQHGGA